MIGHAHVLTGDLDMYAQDWRKKYFGRPLAMLRPAPAAEVAALVRLCTVHARGDRVSRKDTPGCVLGTSGEQVVLNLGRLNGVRSVDPANNTMTVEAGCILQTLQETAESVDRLFPLSLGAEGSCQIGGNISTNAGGVQVLRYGNTHDLVLGLEVVLPSGEILDLCPGVRPIIFGHLGDGNLHFNMARPLALDNARWLEQTGAVNTNVHDAVVRHRGSISAEHGIGQLKQADMAHYKSAAELQVMRAIKRALDPQLLMNPGKVVIWDRSHDGSGSRVRMAVSSAVRNCR